LSSLSPSNLLLFFFLQPSGCHSPQVILQFWQGQLSNRIASIFCFSVHSRLPHLSSSLPWVITHQPSLLIYCSCMKHKWNGFNRLNGILRKFCRSYRKWKTEGLEKYLKYAKYFLYKFCNPNQISFQNKSPKKCIVKMVHIGIAWFHFKLFPNSLHHKYV
jgi:hypothetical protein